MRPLEELVCRVSGAKRAKRVEQIQSLWSGYGEIVRFQVQGLKAQHVIVKHVKPPTEAEHPRGWSGDLSHQRKLRSYQVEQTWYEQFADKLPSQCRTPQLLGSQAATGQSVFVLEDLDEAGFPERRADLEGRELRACLQWLAYFHAAFLGKSIVAANGSSLWQTGTYWHLATRPDEFRAMPTSSLKDAASALDDRLNSARFQTFVHGDAKVANFCFAASTSGTAEAEPTYGVAVVDFQYVGMGCGMKDIAYLLSSCLNSTELDAHAEQCLDFYFAQLVSSARKLAPTVDTEALQSEWRQLYCFAWADFQRFLAGWAPGHYKLHGYCASQTKQALSTL